MKESEFRKKFCDAARVVASVTGVETTTMNGVADLNMVSQGIEVWVELKIADSGRTLIRKEQNAWCRRHAAHGGRCFVVSHDKQEIKVWCFPRIDVTVYGNYLLIGNEPLMTQSDQNLDRVINFLFTFVNP